MKKPAIIIATLLYLSIVTGGFVCMVHCLSNSFLHTAEIAHEHPEAKPDHQEKKDDCKDGEGCECCSDQEHFYFVKENIKPSYHTEVIELAKLVISEEVNTPNVLSETSILKDGLPDSNAPPFAPSLPAFIRYHSLLI